MRLSGLFAMLLVVACRTPPEPGEAVTSTALHCEGGWAPGPVAILDNDSLARSTPPHLLAKTAFQTWPRKDVDPGRVVTYGQFFDWQGARLGEVIEIARASGLNPQLSPDLITAPLDDRAIAAAWFDAGQLHVARVSSDGAMSLASVAIEPARPALVQAVGNAIYVIAVAVPTEEMLLYVVRDGAVAGPTRLAKGSPRRLLAPADRVLLLWSGLEGGPLRVSSLSLAGQRIAADRVFIDATVDAIEACDATGEIVVTTIALTSEPLESILSIGRLTAEGAWAMPLIRLSEPGGYSWSSVLHCSTDRVAVGWVENLPGAVGAVGGTFAVTPTRLRYVEVDTAGVPLAAPLSLAENLHSANYDPRWTLDGPTLVASWTRFEETGYSTPLMKLPCREPR